jgi:hypothetical protein
MVSCMHPHCLMCRLRFLGRLRRMLVQHDNSGPNPAWHLFKVVVRCQQDGRTTTFLCNDWLKATVRTEAQGMSRKHSSCLFSLLPPSITLKHVRHCTVLVGSIHDAKFAGCHVCRRLASAPVWSWRPRMETQRWCLTAWR